MKFKIITALCAASLSAHAISTAISTASQVAVSTATTAAIVAANQHQQQARQFNALNNAAIRHGTSTAVLRCHAYYEKVNTGHYVYTGCDVAGAFSSQFMSFEDFININLRGYELDYVVLDDSYNFYIYAREIKQ